jgi:hypothetical protein
VPGGSKANEHISGEESGQLGEGDASLDPGLVEGSRESSRGEDIGEVDERADGVVTRMP